MKNIIIKNPSEFRKTLKEITNIPEMSLSPYILKSDMDLTESEFKTKYLFSHEITIIDFNLLVDFLKNQKQENIAAIQNIQNEEQITGLINKLVSLTSIEELNEIKNKGKKETAIRTKTMEIENLQKEKTLKKQMQTKQRTKPQRK